MAKCWRCGGRRLDLWAVLYEHQLDKPLATYLGLLDKVKLLDLGFPQTQGSEGKL
jgi:hypothetical protein